EWLTANPASHGREGRHDCLPVATRGGGDAGLQPLVSAGGNPPSELVLGRWQRGPRQRPGERTTPVRPIVRLGTTGNVPSTRKDHGADFFLSEKQRHGE